ncbi:hypothetical protein B0J11DRAFT_231385 [Dendryphion nanum]|uniref:Protein kinase domain-containing protein n=1 Tax=Dendryphion nanum TaxID=256645 RepID=A0A9P9IVI7_9PLEO|nr:hypothetical protein B0J11DRAFT_231385 [Dendryphion nanum]
MLRSKFNVLHKLIFLVNGFNIEYKCAKASQNFTNILPPLLSSYWREESQAFYHLDNQYHSPHRYLPLSDTSSPDHSYTLTMDTGLRLQERIVATFPMNYDFLSIAETGASAHVYFALSSKLLQGAKAPHIDNLNFLCKKLVAIKIFNDISKMNSRKAAKEVQHLRKIGRKADSSRSNLFVSLIDADIRKEGDTEQCKWSVMETICPAISLCYLMQCCGSPLTFPAEFALRLFLQISSALEFLHKEVKILHSYVHSDNILVNSHQKTDCGLPSLVVIDFGCSDSVFAPLNRVNPDVQTMCSHIS